MDKQRSILDGILAKAKKVAHLTVPQHKGIENAATKGTSLLKSFADKIRMAPKTAKPGVNSATADIKLEMAERKSKSYGSPSMEERKSFRPQLERKPKPLPMPKKLPKPTESFPKPRPSGKLLPTRLPTRLPQRPPTAPAPAEPKRALMPIKETDNY